MKLKQVWAEKIGNGCKDIGVEFDNGYACKVSIKKGAGFYEVMQSLHMLIECIAQARGLDIQHQISMKGVRIATDSELVPGTAGHIRSMLKQVDPASIVRDEEGNILEAMIDLSPSALNEFNVIMVKR